MRPGKSFAVKGGLNAHSSYKTHPKDQISHVDVYLLPCHIYGLV